MWLIRLRGWMYQNGSGKSYCDDCCRNIGDGYYEPARKRQALLAPANVCETCLDAAGRGSAAGAAPGPPENPPPGLAPPASPPVQNAADVPDQTSSGESCVDTVADWRFQPIIQRLRLHSPGPSASAGTSASAAAAPGAPAADNDDDEDRKEVMCKTCKKTAPPFQCSGGCSHSWWIRAVGWSGNAGTSNGKKAYCIKCAQRLHKRAWVDGRKEGMRWLCQSCQTKAEQLNEEYVPQPGQTGGPFQ